MWKKIQMQAIVKISLVVLFIMLSSYYLATLVREKTWFVSGVVRGLGHVALERAIDKQNNIFEFFVAPGLEQEFEAVLLRLLQAGVVVSYQRAPNRFASSETC